MSVIWTNGIIHRLLCWAGVIQSPSLGRKPTLKEALTGRLERRELEKMGEEMQKGIQAGLRDGEKD